MQTLRVLTFNLWNDAGDVGRRMEAALTAAADLDLDVVGLQEVRQATGGLEQANAFADRLGAKAEFAVTDSDSPRGPIGNAIVSRLPMRRLAARRLPTPPGDFRVALAVELETARGPLVFITTHLSYELDAAPMREEQVLALDAFARNLGPRALPSIMTGDFNASPDADAIRFLTGRKSLNGRGTYWRDAFARARPAEDGHTWSARNPQVVRHVERNRRIDYIFVGPFGTDERGAIIDAQLALDQPGSAGVYPSDHFAVFAEIALDPIQEPPR